MVGGMFVLYLSYCLLVSVEALPRAFSAVVLLVVCYLHANA